MRNFFVLGCLAVMMLGASAVNAADVPAGYYADQKTVYQNNGGAPDNTTYFNHLLRSIRNQIAAVGKDHVDIRVVDFDAGVQMLKKAKEDKALAAKIDALRGDGVKFLVCANTLKAMGIEASDLYGVKDGDVVPSGVAELARLQGMGFAYIRL